MTAARSDPTMTRDVQRIDAAIEGLKRAADLILKDYADRGNTFGKEQQEGFSQVLGHIIEHLDSLHLVRHGMLTVAMRFDDDVKRLLQSTDAICTKILGTNV
ncbi:hypothetical protein [Burkholderia stagnalis]|uniref:hypothetical protein n=1 Tax=Burkholderia stagnalis TaxID=1503054 RepID=UPI000F55F62F|nr:hypothetical protein [Burkholderia stagnalis]RQR11290.1 hypothetical protein DF025_17115 [Burkholderia stagnalis]RQR20318.1 hypothetical protein DF026_16920 [Burkholderia stagnalis]